MRERRSTRRITVNQTVTVNMEGTSLSTTLIDISIDGALLVISAEDVGQVDDSDLGREVVFRLRIKKQVRLYTGEVIRFFYKDDNLHLALRFWQKPVRAD